MSQFTHPLNVGWLVTLNSVLCFCFRALFSNMPARWATLDWLHIWYPINNYRTASGCGSRKAQLESCWSLTGMCKTEESCGYSFIVLLRKISLIISLMKDLTWCSSLGLFGLWLQRERCEFSAHRLSSLAGSLPRGSSHMPRELLLHVFFLVSFKAAIVGLPAWCPWTVTPLVLRVVSSKHCLAAHAVFTGYLLWVGQECFMTPRTSRSGGTGLVLVLAYGHCP